MEIIVQQHLLNQLLHMLVLSVRPECLRKEVEADVS